MCARVKRVKRNSGFSLIEVVVSMTIISIIFVSTMLAFQRLQKTNEASNEYQKGQSFGSTIMDSLSTLDYSDFEDYVSGRRVERDIGRYRIESLI